MDVGSGCRDTGSIGLRETRLTACRRGLRAEEVRMCDLEREMK